MSTSISLTLSGEQDSRASRSYGDLRLGTTANTEAANRHLLNLNYAPDTNIEHYGRRHTAHLGSKTLAGYAELAGATKLKRWRHQRATTVDSSQELEESQMENQENLQSGGSDYADLEDRLSDCALNERQNKSRDIDRWLNETLGVGGACGGGCGGHTSKNLRSRSFENEDAREGPARSKWGNVIGVRGFSQSASYLGELKCRDYERLRHDYDRLQVEFNRLRCRLQETGQRHERASRRKDTDLEALKATVAKQGKRLESISANANQPGQSCDRCKLRATETDLQLDQVRYEKEHLELRLAHLEREQVVSVEKHRADSERLKCELRDREHEISDLKKQVRKLSLEPSNRTFQALNSENARLKDSSELDQQEYAALRDNYQRLESKLRSLVEDQKFLNHEQNDEMKQIMLELCRLQVYQPKLEMILETEHQIKVQLQSQLESLKEEKSRLEEKICTLTKELNVLKLRQESGDRNQMARLHSEVASWRDKHQKLREELSAVDELYRASKSHLAQVDSKLQREVELVRKSLERDLERAQTNQREQAAAVASLEMELVKLQQQLERSERERDHSNEELIKVHHLLERALSEKPTQDEHQVKLIHDKLAASELDRGQMKRELNSTRLQAAELASKLESTRANLDLSQRQYSELKRRFESLQRAHDELKERKDKELSKLRIDLNFEQYNRQISLKGIEKELRASLRELEAMKYRFSRRLMVENGADSTSNTTSSSSSQPEPIACHQREFRFDDSSSGAKAASLSGRRQQQRNEAQSTSRASSHLQQFDAANPISVDCKSRELDEGCDTCCAPPSPAIVSRRLEHCRS